MLPMDSHHRRDRARRGPPDPEPWKCPSCDRGYAHRGEKHVVTYTIPVTRFGERPNRDLRYLWYQCKCGQVNWGRHVTYPFVTSMDEWEPQNVNRDDGPPEHARDDAAAELDRRVRVLRLLDGEGHGLELFEGRGSRHLRSILGSVYREASVERSERSDLTETAERMTSIYRFCPEYIGALNRVVTEGE